MTGHSAHVQHQISGFKSTLARSDVSDEAKQHARSEIARLEGNGDATHKSHEHAHGEPAKIHDQQVHDHHVIGGFRATLSNDKTSQEAKDHARAELKKLGVDPDSPSTASHSHPTDEEKHLHHQIGGLKAALHNDKVREAKKEELRKRLEGMGSADA